ncbi:MAG: hypothetical protein ACI4E1_15025 [Lachnospira sp.]
MKRLIKQNIKSSRNLTDSQVVFTPADLVNILSQIEELKKLKVSVLNDYDDLKFAIGDYVYRVSR